MSTLGWVVRLRQIEDTRYAAQNTFHICTQEKGLGAITMTTETTPQGRYAKLKDLELYYEVHGSGQPLILLPGSFYTVEAMGSVSCHNWRPHGRSLPWSCKGTGTPARSSAHSASSCWRTISPP